MFLYIPNKNATKRHRVSPQWKELKHHLIVKKEAIWVEKTTFHQFLKKKNLSLFTAYVEWNVKFSSTKQLNI